MAIVVSSLTAGAANNTANPVTASIVIVAGDIVLVSESSYSGADAAATAMSFGGATPGTFVKLGEDATANFRQTLWLGYGCAGTGTITITKATCEKTAWMVNNATNTVNSSAAVGTAVTQNTIGGSPSVSIAALQDANSVAYGSVLGHDGGGAVVVGSSFSQVQRQDQAGPNYGELTETRTNVTTVNASGCGNQGIIIGVEIKTVASNSGSKIYHQQRMRK